MEDTCDVVVVGAGFAGIMAARDLSADGHNVIVLEGRERIGGRTYTDDGIGRSVELGGAYVHWTQSHLWREMRRHDIKFSAPLDVDKIYWIADGRTNSGTAADYDAACAPGIGAFIADSREHFPLPFDDSASDLSVIDKESIADRMANLNLSGYDRDVLDGMLTYTVADPAQQGVTQILKWSAIHFGDWRAMWEAGAYWRIESGTKSLIDAMAEESGADIRLSNPVASVEDTGSEVIVVTRNGDTVRAKAVVIAVPVNTLADIDITPKVSEPVQRFIDEGHPMTNLKMWVRVRGEIEPFNAYAPAGANPITIAMAEYYHEGDTLVVCFCPDATSIDPDDKSAVQEALRAYVPDLEVVDTACEDWASNEFSQGTWMMMRPGQFTECAPQIRKAHGRVHFAGSDIAPFYVGWIEGALESGALVARTVSKTHLA
ncbi:flavin monoamine oxidase family protein [Paenarthrobacter sp. NEAU-H11]|uniref:flavin monoamine oxidase family protein n=1 Tax=Paenarthrobacter sp. NEAU-H11 TaxID=3423924 RepID=UPI003D3380F4